MNDSGPQAFINTDPNIDPALQDLDITRLSPEAQLWIANLLSNAPPPPTGPMEVDVVQPNQTDVFQDPLEDGAPDLFGLLEPTDHGVNPEDDATDDEGDSDPTSSIRTPGRASSSDSPTATPSSVTAVSAPSTPSSPNTVSKRPTASNPFHGLVDGAMRGGSVFSKFT